MTIDDPSQQHEPGVAVGVRRPGLVHDRDVGEPVDEALDGVVAPAARFAFRRLRCAGF